MKLKHSLAFAAFLSVSALISPTLWGQSEASTTVAFPSTTLQTGFNLLGITSHETVLASGTIDGVSGTTVTDTEVDFDAALSAGTKYILEVLSGAAEGAIQEVDSFSGMTIETGDDISSELAAGDKYQLRRASTLERFFGTTTSPLTKAFFPTTADKVWLPNGSGGYDRYYQRADGSWFSADAAPPVAAPDTAIVYTDGLFVERLGSPVTLDAFGEVKLVESSATITTGFNLVAGPYPSGSTVQNSGLGDSLATAFFPTTADKIWILRTDGSGVYDRYFFRNPSDLRSAGVGTPPITTPLELPSGFFIEKAGAPSPANYTIAPPSFYGNL